MNYRELMERTGQQGLTRTADTPAKKKVRAPGDIGKVERIKQIDKDASATVPMQDTADRMKSSGALQRAADKVLMDVGGYTGKRGTKQVKRDATNPDQYADRVSELGKEVRGGESDRGEKLEADPEGTVLPKRTDTADRMAKADLAGKDRVTAADRDFDKTIQSAEAPTVRDSIKVGDEELKDSGELKHAYQPSNLVLKRKKEIDDEAIDAIIGGMQDPDRAGEEGLINQIVQRSAAEDTKNFQPTKRDIEMMSEPGEKAAKDRAYLTDEEKDRARMMRKALDGQNSKKVQDLAFTHDVSDETVDKFIDRFGQTTKKSKGKYSNLLQNSMKGIGAADARGHGAYGGDLGPEAKEAETSPGVYDMTKLKEIDPKLADQATENRTKALVKTYLRQGGVNAYAPHEGGRSILDMDLEHIKSLTQGGADHPDNWVFASQNLNRLRGNEDLGPFVDKKMDEPAVSPGIGAKLGGMPMEAQKPGDVKKSFKQFFGDDKEAMKKFNDDFGQPGTKNKNSGIFDKENYQNYTQDEVESLRKKAIDNYGMSEDQTKGFFPDSGRIGGESYGQDPDAYERDQITNERDQVLYRKGLDMLKGQLGNIGNDALKKSPEGQEFMRQIKELGPSGFQMKDLEKIVASVQGDTKAKPRRNRAL